MKIVSLLLVFTLISCGKSNVDIDMIHNDSISNNIVDTTGILQNKDLLPAQRLLDTFCKEIISYEPEKISKYFDFPIEDNSNFYIRALADLNAELKSDPQDTDSISMPITKENFTTNFSKIISGDFINAMKLLNTKDLFKKGVYETPYIIKDQEAKYNLYTVFDKEKELITLSLGYIFIDEGEEYGTSVSYILNYEQNNIKVKSIIIAD